MAKGSSIQFRVSKGPDPNNTSEPSTAPSTEPSTQPTQTPGGGSGAAEKTVPVQVDLPRDGRETVEVVITVDGERKYAETVETKMMSVVVPLTSSGTRTVTVYIDGQEAWSRAIPFS